MSQTAFSWSVGVVFLLIAFAHLLRVAFNVDWIVEGIAIPLWASGIAVVIAGFLAYEGFHFARKTPPKV
jgi:hypothetical protein